jgi:hypothetical protein
VEQILNKKKNWNLTNFETKHNSNLINFLIWRNFKFEWILKNINKKLNLNKFNTIFFKFEQNLKTYFFKIWNKIQN